MRWFYDLSGMSYQTGHIGYLKTLHVLPIVAGDTIDVNIEGLIRLSPLRRNMTVDAVVDLLAFYCPRRHAYDSGGRSLWTDFIKGGVDEAVTFPVWTVPNGNWRHAAFGVEIPATRSVGLWMPFDYAQIHNRYFRHPLDFEDIRAKGVTPASFVSSLWSSSNLTGWRSNFADPDAASRYNRGFRVCHLKRPWNSYMPDLPAADRQVPAASVIDILELRRTKAEYKTKLERVYFGQRYDDLLQRIWDASVSIDADERPELVMRKRQFLSGIDINGTDDASLGQYSGKSVTVVNMNIPKRYFAEHGALWFMAVVRFPPLIYSEWHPMFKAQPTYKEIAGDPTVIAAEPPQDLNLRDWFSEFNGDTYLGNAQSRSGEPNTPARPVIPHSQWYRYGHSSIDPRFESVQGFPFLNTNSARLSSGQTAAPYVRAGVYDSMFQNRTLENWHCQLKLSIGAMRKIPPAIHSIMAGTR